MSACLPRFLSALLLSLSTMLHLALPHVNVLSKVAPALRLLDLPAALRRV